MSVLFCMHDRKTNHQVPQVRGQSHANLRATLSGIRWSQRSGRLLLRRVPVRSRGHPEGQSPGLQLAREYEGLVSPSFSTGYGGAPRRAA
jgi:hypothetical protein